MTWPTTPISTTHLDAGSDSPAQARADIKLMADAVNAIQTEFSDGDGAKLAAIEAGATADQTGSEIKSLYESEADTNAFTDSEKTKLSTATTSVDFVSIVKLTQAEYDALTPSADTLYIIVG